MYVCLYVSLCLNIIGNIFYSEVVLSSEYHTNPHTLISEPLSDVSIYVISRLNIYYVFDTVVYHYMAVILVIYTYTLNINQQKIP